jgi:hypothetical protein
MRGDSAVWAVDVDPQVNRIWLGLHDPPELARIQQRIMDASVPLAAVVIEAPPPVTGTEPFAVLDAPIVTRTGSMAGVFEFAFHVRYTNLFQETRYPDQCVELFSSYSFFLYTLEQWDRGQWRRVYTPPCDLVALTPRPVSPGQTQTDSIPAVAVRRLNSMPVWQTARITGTYRLVGSVYLSAIPNPPFVTNPAPPAERVSRPFRITHTLPF